MPQKKISRSKVELFTECPRCFYLDIVKSVKRPAGFPFNINSAVDSLLKKEFDRHRADGTSHPLQTQFGLNLIPANHTQIDQWRHNFTGVQYFDHTNDILWYGAIDDLWIDTNGIYYVVDYKATAKSTPVTELAEWTGGYKRQMEFYQWLLRKNGLTVSDTGYFVYCTGDNNRNDFSNVVHFHSHIIPYTGNDSWVQDRLDNLIVTMNAAATPIPSVACAYCQYIDNYVNNIA
jgi:hypothetical protein